MRAAMLAVVVLGLFGGSAAGEVLIDSDFGAGGRTIDSEHAEGRVTGRLPAGWRDNSSWARAWVNYEPKREKGRTFTRVDVERIEEGWAQAAFDLPDVEGTGLMRLSLEARSPTGMGAEVGIRQRDRPYRFLWRTGLATGPQWRKFSYRFTLERNRQPIGLYLVMNSVGALDLANLRLERVSRRELAEELRAKYPEGGPPNLLRNSRFPLGMQSGWSLGRDTSDGDEVVVESDPDAVGPSGAPSLRVRAQEPWRLYGEPFTVPVPTDEHTATLYARGEGKLRVSVLADARPIGVAEQRLEEEWRRIRLRFQPMLTAEVYGLRLEGAGDVWVDAVQVAHGEKPRPYAARMGPEVALGLPESEAANARIQFADEPARVLWAATGAPEGAVLRAKAVNAYGGSKPLGKTLLGEGFLQRGEVGYDLFPERPYGAFRIEAWVEDADGERISPPNEIVVFRLRRPRHWGEDAPDSPFGVHTSSTTRHNRMAKAVGCNWVRLHDCGLAYIGWYHLEPEPGRWEFRDRALRRYRQEDLKILGMLSTAPKWASHYPGYEVSGYFDRFYQPKRMEDFANYVRVVAERYRGVIDTWDVWNEPWIEAWWGVDHDRAVGGRAGYITSEHPQADFARMMKAAHRAVKSVDPEATVLGVNSTAGSSGAEWSRGVVEAGGLQWCDVACYHQYTGGVLAHPDDAVQRGFRTAMGPLPTEGGEPARPVWMTEGSAGRELLGNGMYRHTVPGQSPEANLAAGDRLCRFVVSLLAAGCRKTFLYSMHSHSYFGRESAWNVLVGPDGYLHPSAAAYSAMAWELEGTGFAERIEPAENVFAYLFEAPGGSRSVAVLAPRPRHAEYPLPGGAELTLRDLLGNPLEAGSVLGRRLVYVQAEMPADQLRERLLPR